jgi:16S rRNA (guanine527-N7)-methyltransferase
VVEAQLEAYFRLLAHWNQTINLTALPLDDPTDEAVDRLIIEPLLAARESGSPSNWYDLGSGGGSPAIPFKIAHPRATLTMVEARSKKAAFLREAIRVLELIETGVEQKRFEDVAGTPQRRATADLVTIRAVRQDEALFTALANLLAAGGRAFLFEPRGLALEMPPGLATEKTVELGTERAATLRIVRRVFHVEQ